MRLIRLAVAAFVLAPVALMGAPRQNYGYTLQGWGIGDSISEAHAKADMNASDRCNANECTNRSPTGGSYIGASKNVAPGKNNTGDGPCGYTYDIIGGVVFKAWGCDNTVSAQMTDENDNPTDRWMYFVSGICTCQSEDEYNLPVSKGGRVELTPVQKVLQFFGLFRPTGPKRGGA
jgi:hypothetical protein